MATDDIGLLKCYFVERQKNWSSECFKKCVCQKTSPNTCATRNIDNDVFRISKFGYYKFVVNGGVALFLTWEIAVR